MIGHVDDSGRAMISIEFVANPSKSTQTIDAWIDTGFTGDLVLPNALVSHLCLPVSGSVDGILADGSLTVLKTYHCRIRWFGRNKDLEAIANDGEFPLLGVGLLLAKELKIDYTNLLVALTPSHKNSRVDDRPKSLDCRQVIPVSENTWCPPTTRDHLTDSRFRMGKAYSIRQR